MINRISIQFGTKICHRKEQVIKKQDLGSVLARAEAVRLQILKRFRALMLTLTDSQRWEIADWFANKANDKLYAKIFYDIRRAYEADMAEAKKLLQETTGKVAEWSSDQKPAVGFASDSPGWKQ